MSQTKKGSIGIYILSAFIGSFFLFSAITKTQPVESFEYTLRTQLAMSGFAAAYWARFFIGLEGALGLLLLANVFGRQKWVIMAAFWLVVAFTIHLILMVMNLGNDVSCGCMGDWIPMLPIPAIIKNIVLLILLGILWRLAPRNDSAEQQWLSIGLMVIIVAIPYFIFKHQPKVLDVAKLYKIEDKYKPSEDLRKGKHFVAFMSLTCTHCMDAARILTKMKNEDPSLPIYAIFGDVAADSTRNEMLDNFKRETKFSGIPYTFLDRDDFVHLTKGFVPAMYWIEDSKIVRELNVGNLDRKELELWLKQKN